MIACLILVCCKKHEEEEPVTPSPEITKLQDRYWGCWKEYKNDPTYHDIRLTKSDAGRHGFQLGQNCVGLSAAPRQNNGFFRNDTLILDNGNFEYWCFLKSDTLYYNAYIPNPKPAAKFLKMK